MDTTELLRALDTLDRQHSIWLVTPMLLKRLFPQESDRALKASVKRHCSNGLLTFVCKGLYANERAACQPGARLEALVPYLRPGELNYISQESRLSELGVISQIPVSHLTVMTTGVSHWQSTAFGSIEFTHTSRAPERIVPHLIDTGDAALPVADLDLALMDLRRAGRNINLIDDEMVAQLRAEAS